MIIYRHRAGRRQLRRGLAAIPAVIDDSVLVESGDVDAMTIENLGREDLTELQQAEMFACYSEAGLGQRAIADRLGVHQTTVSRGLRLLLLTPEVWEAVERGKMKSAEAGSWPASCPTVRHCRGRKTLTRIKNQTSAEPISARPTSLWWCRVRILSEPPNVSSQNAERAGAPPPRVSRSSTRGPGTRYRWACVLPRRSRAGRCQFVQGAHCCDEGALRRMPATARRSPTARETSAACGRPVAKRIVSAALAMASQRHGPADARPIIPPLRRPVTDYRQKPY